MTAIFVILPHQLTEVMGLSVRQQGLVYLPLLFVGFAVAIPFIIIAEKKRKMRQVFLAAIALMTAALAFLAFGSQVGVGIILDCYCTLWVLICLRRRFHLGYLSVHQSPIKQPRWGLIHRASFRCVRWWRDGRAAIESV